MSHLGEENAPLAGPSKNRTVPPQVPPNSYHNPYPLLQSPTTLPYATGPNALVQPHVPPPIHLYTPGQVTERTRPQLSLPDLPQPPVMFPLSPHIQLPYTFGQPIPSPYLSPLGMMAQDGSSAGSSGAGMSDYFQTGLHSHTQQNQPSISPNWSSTAPLQTPSQGGSNSQSGHGSGNKSSRQQFTACGACRHRRVKCDLKDRQEAAHLGEINERGNAESSGRRRKRISCTNCEERGMNCIDEYAPIKAQKQLRRGKRISEIEMRYGKAAANAAVATQRSDSHSDDEGSPKEKPVALPELTREFFDSPFFRRFHVQRPIVDPVDFVARFFSTPTPCAANLGPAGSIICHILYAWAVSYGVDENGQLDVPEGGGVPLGAMNLLAPSHAEIEREEHRQRRRSKMTSVLHVVLKEIDEFGLMRKPSWDGVRALLLVLPLTDGISSQVERLAMYEAAVAQVFALCSHGSIGYDGHLSQTSAVNGGSDNYNGQDLQLVRIRIYWYAFVHEGITTGLKGGRLILDDEDLDTMQETINLQAVVHSSDTFRSIARMATAPIRLALACRLIHKALTGPKAKRKATVDGDSLREAWEALESCAEEFESIKYEATVSAYNHQDDIIRFADGWKIFLFEAQNVIRKSLEERLSNLNAQRSSAYLSDLNSTNNSPDVKHGDSIHLQHLLDIARSKCEVQTRHIMDIVKRHVGTRFFEWDASLVRDGTYYVAMLLAQAGGSDEDVAICLQALNELRWAHGKSWERSQDLRREWLESHSMPSKPLDSTIQGWDPSTYPLDPSSQLERISSVSSAPQPYNVNLDTGILSTTSSFPSPDLISPGYDESSTTAIMTSGQMSGYTTRGPSRNNSFGLPNQNTGSGQGLSGMNDDRGLLIAGGLDYFHGVSEDQKWSNANTTNQGSGYNGDGTGNGGEGGQIPLSDYTAFIVPHQGSSVMTPDLNQQQQGQPLHGQYVIGPDGTQVFIPFAMM